MTTAFSDETLRNASEWYARLHGGDATAQDHVRLGDWLAARPENQQAYEFVTETGRLAAHVHPASNGRRRPAPARRSSLRDVRTGVSAARRRWARAAGVAAAAVIVAGIGVAIVNQPHEQSYQTAVGEIRNVTLADGSTLALNGATKLTVRFTHEARDLDIETGEFFVTVTDVPGEVAGLLFESPGVDAVIVSVPAGSEGTTSVAVPPVIGAFPSDAPPL